MKITKVKVKVDELESTIKVEHYFGTEFHDEEAGQCIRLFTKEGIRSEVIREGNLSLIRCEKETVGTGVWAAKYVEGCLSEEEEIDIIVKELVDKLEEKYLTTYENVKKTYENIKGLQDIMV